MIRFLYGAGSAETRGRLEASIREDLASGAKALLIVPEQETVSVERRMLETLPASAQLSFEVLNFSRLANRTFRTLGGLSYRDLASSERLIKSLDPTGVYISTGFDQPEKVDKMIELVEKWSN